MPCADASDDEEQEEGECDREQEEQHQAVFRYLANAVKDGTLYKCESPTLWICSECGHMHVSTEAWKVCPLCKAEQGYVELHLPFEGVKY